MHYLDVHILYIILPTFFAIRYAFERARKDWVRHGAQSLVAMSVLATIWTTPWDNLMLYHQVWTYPPDAVLGTIFYVPIEEHLFFILQPLLTGSVTIWALRNRTRPRMRPSRLVRYVGFLLAFGLFAAGYLLLEEQSGYYLGSTLLWFAPVFMLQWWIGADRLVPRLDTLVPVVAVCTLYLCLVDGIAMRSDVWAISKAHTLGPGIGNVPLEEIVFFLVTNMLVVTGVTLYVDLVRGWKWDD